MGYPLPRFYYAHCLFEKQRLPEAVEHATKYIESGGRARPVRPCPSVRSPRCACLALWQVP